MTTTKHTARLAYDDCGNGPLLVMLPGAGDVRTEYRSMVDRLVDAGYRVVTADLPGHGDSPLAPTYTVASTAAAVIDLIEHLDDGAATVIATSFAPAAAVWAAVDRPDLVSAVVAISAHLDADNSLKGQLQTGAIRAMLAGPWAPSAWARIYRSWYKQVEPTDLDREIRRMRSMLADSARRRAVLETLTANRNGMAERIAALSVPTLAVYGSADDHFVDASAEAAAVAQRLGGEHLVVEGAGHYPHVEFPDLVTALILDFLA
ncbi:MAG: alpha/beta fold hydrolase [Acidimicrobiia bacterium]